MFDEPQEEQEEENITVGFLTFFTKFVIFFLDKMNFGPVVRKEFLLPSVQGMSFQTLNVQNNMNLLGVDSWGRPKHMFKEIYNIAFLSSTFR